MAKAEKTTKEESVSVSTLAEALKEAIDVSRPQKKNVFTRKKNTPWTPKDGSPKLKLKRKMYHHGVPVNEKFSSNEEIDLLNKVRPGKYCDNWITISRRNDKGVNIDYPVRTKAQIMRLANSYGINSLVQLLQRCVDEAANPRQYKTEEELD